MALWRKALFPIQILFRTAVLLRKTIYKSSLYKRYSASVPVLVVGNLASGGTGKTPMVDYILTHFSKQYVLGMLSRGYGRQTKGYRHVSKHSRANEVGDEPLMLAQKHANVVVSVCERRPEGLQKMQSDFPNIQAFVLDDALQHLPLLPSFRIVLTTFQKPWFSDAVLPVGDLREPATASRDADVVVVTKCPSDLDPATKEAFHTKLGIHSKQQLYFTTLEYDTHVRGAADRPLAEFIQTPFVLLTGIANPATLVDFLEDKSATFTHKSFADHHRFSKTEIDALRALNQPILTTEKDAVRLAPYELINLYTLGVRVRFLEDEVKFIEIIETGLQTVPVK